MIGSSSPSWFAKALALLAATFVVAAEAAAPIAWLSKGPELPDVTLIDQDGRNVRLAEIAGDRAIVVSFFLTTCSTICPVQTAILREVRNILAKRLSEPLASRALILSISVDPLADKPAQLEHYAKSFDIRLGEVEGWLLLTGSVEAAAAASAAFDEPNGAGAADHSGTIWIGRPKARRWVRIPVSSPDAASPDAIAGLVLEAAK